MQCSKFEGAHINFKHLCGSLGVRTCCLKMNKSTKYINSGSTAVKTREVAVQKN